MKINIKATNIELTDAIKNYINSKLKGIERFLKNDKEELIIQVEVGRTTKKQKKGDYFRAEFNAEISGKNYYVSSQKSNLYEAIDEAKDLLFRKMGYSKDKKRTLVRRGDKLIKKITRGFSSRSESK